MNNTRMAPKEPFVFLINGTPGTGKTSLANMLRSFGFQIIDLNQFAKEVDCIDSFDLEMDTEIVEEECLEGKLREFLQNMDGSLVLGIEGHLVDLCPPEFVKICFVLTRNRKELLAEYKNRNYNPRKIEDNLTAEIMQECYIASVNAFGIDKVVVVENTDLETLAIEINSKIKTLFRQE